jgi:hypothetical protein
MRDWGRGRGRLFAAKNGTNGTSALAMNAAVQTASRLRAG